MHTLALKLVLSPLLILAATLAGRRWGEAVGGWFVGLPLTTAPVVLFLGLDHGTGYALEGALGALGGTAVEAAFCLAYAGAARHGWPAAIAAASLAFAAGAVLLRSLPLPPWALLPVALAALAAALWLLRESESGCVAAGPSLRARPRWDLPARMVTAAALVLGLTGAAPFVGPGTSGIVATYPVFAAVLTVFAHRTQGPAAAISVLRGLLTGLFAFAGFFFVLTLLLPPAGLAAAFGAATAAALTIQGASLSLMRRHARNR